MKPLCQAPPVVDKANLVLPSESRPGSGQEWKGTGRQRDAGRMEWGHALGCVQQGGPRPAGGPLGLAGGRVFKFLVLRRAEWK